MILRFYSVGRVIICTVCCVHRLVVRWQISSCILRIDGDVRSFDACQVNPFQQMFLHTNCMRMAFSPVHLLLHGVWAMANSVGHRLDEHIFHIADVLNRWTNHYGRANDERNCTSTMWCTHIVCIEMAAAALAPAWIDGVAF